MTISASDVKKLRDMTGAGMMDAKRLFQKVLVILIKQLNF